MLENYIDRSMIASQICSSTKDSAFFELSELMVLHHRALSAKVIAEALKMREELGSTGIEKGIAIPHAKINGIDKIIIVVGRSKEGINFDSHDGLPVHLLFIMFAPDGASGEHLKVMARLVKILGRKGITEKLLKAFDADEIYNVLLEADLC